MLKKFLNGKSWTYIFVLTLFTVLTVWGYLYLVNEFGLENIQDWAFNNFYYIFFVLLFVKVLGIIWPPLPGGAFIVASVPAIGWFWAWIIDFLGVFIGASLAFRTSSKHGLNILSTFLSEDLIDKIEKVRVRKKNETEFVFIISLISGPVAEAVYYGSPILKVEYRHFIVGVLMANAVYSLPSLYLVENFLTGDAILFSTILMILLLSIFSLFRKRYFEYE
jgi:uncharacterized membrane protein YdjX (TVP38/TMEM64 family)